MTERSGGARRKLVGWIASAASVAIVATIAVVAAGFDARETPREEPSVWAMRSSGQYARVNTLTGEIDTVRKVEEPSGLVQLGPLGVLFSHGGGRAWTIDPALPADLGDEGAADEGADGREATEDPAEDLANGAGADSAAMRTPAGTREVVAAGSAVVFRTDGGDAFLSRVEESGAALGAPQLLDTAAERRSAEEAAEDPESGEAAGSSRARADAVAVDDDGRVAVFSAQDHALHWFDAATGKPDGDVSEVPQEVPEGVQLAIVAGEWAMLDADAGELWLQGAQQAISVELSGAAELQASSTARAGAGVLVADSEGLWRVGERPERVESFSGTPVQPIQLGDQRFAAWIGQADGRLWSSADGAIPLEIEEGVEVPGAPELTFRTSGTNAVLSEVQTGMLWTVPDGELIPVQQWVQNEPPKQREGTVVVEDVSEQEPPVATDDSFGVRAGEPATLPVLLNDYDPNRRDVLTIVPESTGDGLPESFGEVATLADGQSLVVRPSADANGTASFRYRVTDGVKTSDPATVTLNVVGEKTNTAPGWCAVEGCQREWPGPELTPGGTAVLPILEGWVDAEGDPMVLGRATKVNPDDPISVLVTAEGRLAIRHEDPGAPDSDVVVRVEVADSRGESTERELRVRIRSNAKAEMQPMAASVTLGRASQLQPLGRIVGGSGSFSLVDASVSSGSAQVAVNAGAGAIEVTAKQAGVTTLTLIARDDVTDAEITGVLRVTAAESDGDLVLPPLQAFVRPLADSTVDVLDAVPGAASRPLVVRSADTVDGDLQVDVVEHANVRVSGATPEGMPGRIGAVDVTVAEGPDTAVGRLTVFQVAEDYTGAIAVTDNATVRAGAVVDIRVLDNDVAPPGQRLVLHPEVGGSGEPGELAFASGSTLRYLAPMTPGTHTLSYTAYSAGSPDEGVVGQVRVTVMPREGNRDPQPRALTARVAAGGQATVTVPLSGVDPDGDRVRVVDVSSGDDPQVTATLTPRTAGVHVQVAKGAAPGDRTFSYTVRDDFGGEAEGRLRVVVIDEDDRGNAPITYSDYVRLVQGAEAPIVVRPTDNDLDPAGGKLELLEVVPNVSGGGDSRMHRELDARLDTSELKQGRVLVRGSEHPGTVSYRYTARSTESESTSEGLIVVQVSGSVGRQAPAVQDTVLTAGDRADLERGGVDVLTNKVTWAGGDVASLKMSLRGGAAERYTAKGGKISGTYHPEGDLVPFRLAGIDHTGEEVETFGFLVIPSLDELRLTLKSGFSSVIVGEGEAVDVALADAIELPSGEAAEFKTGPLPTQRAEAVCEAVSTQTIRYSAGSGAPWADSCMVSVRLVEQTSWTRLTLPVAIVPKDPTVELRPLTRTVRPGETEAIDLGDMVSWQGGREGDTSRLSFAVSGGGDSFDVSVQGRIATVTAAAGAAPGTQSDLTVAVTGSGDSRSTLTVRVGQVAKDQPRGATVAQECQVGTSCKIKVIGAPGEYDPFAGGPGAGLKLKSVSTGECRVATFSAERNDVSVAWPDGAGGPGGMCTATFTVSDAQGRVGSGSIELAALGVPRAPTSIALQGTPDATSLKLLVTLSGVSYPAAEGARVLMDGERAGSCRGSGSSYTCEVRGLEKGERHSFTAVAVNSVGESQPTENAVTAWAYDPPSVPQVRAKQVSAESTASGTAELTITGGDDVAGYRVTVGGRERRVTGQNATVTIDGLPANAETSYEVVPRSRFQPPGDAEAEGRAATGSLRVGGLPSVSVSAISERGSRDVRATVTVNSNGGADVSYGVELGNRCEASQHTGTGDTHTLRASSLFKTETVSACARNRWGVAEVATTDVWVGGNPFAPQVREGYRLSRTPDYSSGPVSQPTRTWSAVDRQPSFSNREPGAVLSYDTGATGELQQIPLGASSVQVKQSIGGRESEWATVPERNGDAAARVSWRLAEGCIASDRALADAFEWVGGRGGAAPIFTPRGLDIEVGWDGWDSTTFTDAICEPDPTEPPTETEPDKAPAEETP